ncbi:12061_t:CDS:2 [Entrophospora sp. SA101]|nr:12061_t:CDS:2 [Entrophospora sp. SA101]
MESGCHYYNDAVGEEDDLETSLKRPRLNNDHPLCHKHTPCSTGMLKLPPLINDDDYDEEEEGEEITVIRNFPRELSSVSRDFENDFFVGEQRLFHEYKNESIELSNTCGLYVETNVREILALTSILWVHQILIQTYDKQLSPKNKQDRKGAYAEQLLKIEDKIKEVEKEAGTEEEKPARNLGFIILEGLKQSKARKLEGRAKQPNFTVIHQLQTDGVLFVGEVTPSAEKGNVLENCNDLIRVGIFMKDCIDSAVDKGADVKVDMLIASDCYTLNPANRLLATFNSQYLISIFLIAIKSYTIMIAKVLPLLTEHVQVQYLYEKQLLS